MTAVWVTIGALCVGSIAIKAAGPVVLGGRELPARAADVIALVAPALLTALVVVETVGGEDGELVLDARMGGVLAAGGALALRLPITIVVLVAAVAAAVIRALA
jgi:Branched-chain amino acid transport protein (AzlD)